MSSISATYNRVIIFWNFLISCKTFFSQLVKRNVIITNKNGKYKLTDELPNDVTLKKISKLHGIII